jgi:hypothetical protein
MNEDNRWFAEAEGGMWAVGSGDEQIALCKYRADAMRLRDCIDHERADWNVMERAIDVFRIIKETDPGDYDELIDPVLELLEERGNTLLGYDHEYEQQEWLKAEALLKEEEKI